MALRILTHATSRLTKYIRQFANSIISADDILPVTQRCRASADRDAIGRCVFRIVNAFATVEGLSEGEMQDLLGASTCSTHSIVLPYVAHSLVPIIRRDWKPPFDD